MRERDSEVGGEGGREGGEQWAGAQGEGRGERQERTNLGKPV